MLRVGMIVRASSTAVLLLAAGIISEAAWAQPNVQAPSIRAAQSTAQKWLNEIDGRDFEEAWEDAAPSFRGATGRERWVQANTRLADSLGSPSVRSLNDVQRRDSIRQTAGPFVILTYRATFDETPFEELLVLTRTEDDWRVNGYKISPVSREPPSVPSSRSITVHE